MPVYFLFWLSLLLSAVLLGFDSENTSDRLQQQTIYVISRKKKKKRFTVQRRTKKAKIRTKGSKIQIVR